MTTLLLAAVLRPAFLAADGGDLGGAGPWLNFGAIGLLAFVLFLGYRALLEFARGAHQRERDRADRADEEVRALNAEIRARDAELRDKWVPTMTDVVRVLGDVTALLRERR